MTRLARSRIRRALLPILIASLAVAMTPAVHVEGAPFDVPSSTELDPVATKAAMSPARLAAAVLIVPRWNCWLTPPGTVC